MLPTIITGLTSSISNIIAQGQTLPLNSEPGNWFQYGIAGVLAILLLYLIKYIIQRDKHDQENALERSKLYREDNETRDKRFLDVIKSIDINGQRFVDSTNSNIEKFITLVNKVMEMSQYQTQVLVELREVVIKLPPEFEALRKDIKEALDKLTLQYEIKPKEK